MLDVEGFILVGGASSRMGEDKSRLVFNGKSTIEMISQAMRPVTPTIHTVGSLQIDPSGLPDVPDLIGRWGPLGGIQAALRAAVSEQCLIVACDLPFVSADLFTRLLELSGDSDATVPIQADGYRQALCAIYRRLPCLEAAERSIAKAEHSPRAVLDKVKTRYVPFDEISDLNQANLFFFNVNTPGDRQRANEIAAGRS
jgi:molybdopterin-guanine dinucleotide biosynthesis protein A